MGFLYKLTSPNGKSYIGITSKTLDIRWAKHVEHAIGKRDNGALYAALRKHGPENFKKEILAEEDDWDKLCELERNAIKEYKTLSPLGYNIAPGGEGVIGPRDEACKKKISAAQKKRYQCPGEKERLFRAGEKGRENTRRRNLENPRPPKPKKPLMSKEDRSRRIREGMAMPEAREKVIRCARERAKNPSWRRNISESKRGKKTKPASAQRKRLISEARRREWADPEMRAKRLAGFALARKGKNEH